MSKEEFKSCQVNRAEAYKRKVARTDAENTAKDIVDSSTDKSGRPTAKDCVGESSTRYS